MKTLKQANEALEKARDLAYAANTNAERSKARKELVRALAVYWGIIDRFPR